MALTVEDGTGLAGAESYVSVADATTYFTAHGSPAAWTGLATDAAKESALRYAVRWLDARYAWPGELESETQALAWPRLDAYDREGRNLSGTVPQLVKDAQCEAALLHVAGALNATRARAGLVKRIKVGPVEQEFADGAPGGRSVPFVDALLANIARYGGGSAFGAVRLVRVS